MRQGRKHGVPLSKNLGQLEVVGVEKGIFAGVRHSLHASPQGF